MRGSPTIGRRRGLPARTVLLSAALLASLLSSGCTMTLHLPGLSIELLEGLLGTLVWLSANVAYLEYRRSGGRGAGRFFAFWLGLPTTVITACAVSEGRPALEPPEDDDLDAETLLAEWHAYRAGLQAGPEDGSSAARPGAADGTGMDRRTTESR